MVSNCIKVMLIGVVIINCLFIGSAGAIPAGQLVISELQTGSATSAGNEFIELYNPTGSAIELSAWRLEYNAAAHSDWSKPYRKIPLSGSIGPKAYFLLASSDYSALHPALTYSSTLAAAGGHLRLVNGAVAADLVGWGTAAGALVSPAPAPPAGSSIIRNFDALNPGATSSNALDFAVSSQPTPGTANAAKEAPASLASGASGPEAAVLEISELLPNPASPATDASGEFIELYNPGPEAAALTGFKLTSGMTDSRKYVLPALELGARQYLVLPITQSHLSLSNTAGHVRLYDNGGTLIDQTGDYSKAPAGQAWIFSGGVWQWTSKPTPGGQNVLIVAAVISKPPKTKTVLAVVKTKKAKVAKAAKKPRPAAITTRANSLPPTLEQEQKSASHPFVLAGAGGLAVLYACYEYRHEMADRSHKFRKNFLARRAARRAA